jgi:hypothetical protein
VTVIPALSTRGRPSSGTYSVGRQTRLEVNLNEQVGTCLFCDVNAEGSG